MMVSGLSDGDSNRTNSLRIDVGLRRHAIGRRQDVLHRLPAPVAGNLIVPLATKTGKASPVRRDNDVTLSRHQVKIPTV